jgi:hypothetical protein
MPFLPDLFCEHTTSPSVVIAGLVPAIPLRDALCPHKRDPRDKPAGDEERVEPSRPIRLELVA